MIQDVGMVKYDIYTWFFVQSWLYDKLHIY
jgi:hypothetical protein